MKGLAPFRCAALTIVDYTNITISHAYLIQPISIMSA